MNFTNILILSLSLMPIMSLADSSTCGLISDADQRAYCRATSGDGASQCGLIQNSDLRAMCRAETTGNGSVCGLINDANMRALCRAKLGG